MCACDKKVFIYHGLIISWYIDSISFSGRSRVCCGLLWGVVNHIHLCAVYQGGWGGSGTVAYERDVSWGCNV